MKSAIPSDLLKLKKRFEAWRNTRAKRSKTPDRPQAGKPLHPLEAQELSVVLYNGLPDRAQFAEAWRKVDSYSFTRAALFLLHSKQELFHSQNRCVFSLE